MQTYVTTKTLEVIADFMEAYPKETKQLNESVKLRHANSGDTEVVKDEYKKGLL